MNIPPKMTILDNYSLNINCTMVDVRDYAFRTSYCTTPAAVKAKENCRIQELLFRTCLFDFQCLGADTLFDQLGIDVDKAADHDHLGELSSLVVYHLLTGKNLEPEN